MSEKQKAFLLVGVFLLANFLPLQHPRVQQALLEGFFLLRDYAREHVLLCLVPAFFIAGAIAAFLSQASVLRYLGPRAPRVVAYSVAATSGAALAVCSCTVLPLFAGIYRRGAGLGPAIAFLYSGPAINVLAIVFTARVLGWQLGVARALGAVVFAVVIGVLMAYLFHGDTRETAPPQASFALDRGERTRRGWQDGASLAVMVSILVLANWAAPQQPGGIFSFVYRWRWLPVAGLAVVLAYQLRRWFNAGERSSWLAFTWDFAKQIMPLLFVGVLVSGWALGRPGRDSGLIPASWIHGLVGGNSWSANLLAALVGAFMYFATLTEVPIVQGLLGAGMGQGPALALLLAGPALSLPNMLVINSYLGPKKTLAYCFMVVAMASISGFAFGLLVG